MKKLKTREETQWSERRKKFIVGGILTVIMLFSTVGFALIGGSGFGGNKAQEDGPTYDGNYFNYNFNGRQLSFVTSVDNTKSIEVELNKGIDFYSGKEVYLVGSEDYVLSEIGRNLGQFSGRVQKACYGACEEDLPENSCDEVLIVFNRSDDKRVYQEDNCTFINGDIASADAFLYNLFKLD